MSDWFYEKIINPMNTDEVYALNQKSLSLD